MNGWTGKILNVDLTSGRIWRADIPEHSCIPISVGAGYQNDAGRVPPRHV